MLIGHFRWEIASNTRAAKGGGVLPIEGDKVGQHMTQSINMQVSQLMAFHQCDDQTAAGLEPQPFELQHRMGPRIYTSQIPGTRKVYPFTIAELILTV